MSEVLVLAQFSDSTFLIEQIVKYNFSQSIYTVSSKGERVLICTVGWSQLYGIAEGKERNVTDL